MSEGTGSTVDCPVCGEQFDPAAAGGWCTNPDCGEWRHDIEDDAGPVGEPEDDASGTRPSTEAQTAGTGPSSPEAEGTDSPGAEGDFTRGGSGNLSGDESPDDRDAPDDESTGDTEDDDGTVDPLGSSPSEEAAGPAADADDEDGDDADDDEWGAFEPVDSTDEGETGSDDADDTVDGSGTGPPAEADPDAESEAVASAEGELDLGEEEPADEPTGAETEEEAEEQVAAPEQSDAAADLGPEGGSEADDGPEPPEALACPACDAEVTADAQFCPECGTDVSHLPETDEARQACPDCGAEVSEDDSFCASCGADLSDTGSEPEHDPLTECPECGADVDGDDVYCASCGEELEPHRGDDVAGGSTGGAEDAGTGEAEPAPEVLALSARGREVRVADGDAVGRQVRRIIIDTDGDEDEAVRVHREHVRFVREDGQFYVVDLGDNPTVVNGEHMEKGDREPIGPGDELGLSGVVTLSVGRP